MSAKSLEHTPLSVAADELGLEMQGEDLAQGHVDDVAVVVTRPSEGQESAEQSGARVLVGPSAESWMNNEAPQQSEDGTDTIEEELVVGQCAGWLGVDVVSRTSFEELDSDDIVNAVSSAIGCFRGVD